MTVKNNKSINLEKHKESSITRQWSLRWFLILKSRNSENYWNSSWFNRICHWLQPKYGYTADFYKKETNHLTNVALRSASWKTLATSSFISCLVLCVAIISSSCTCSGDCDVFEISFWNDTKNDDKNTLIDYSETVNKVIEKSDFAVFKTS